MVIQLQFESNNDPIGLFVIIFVRLFEHIFQIRDDIILKNKSLVDTSNNIISNINQLDVKL